MKKIVAYKIITSSRSGDREDYLESMVNQSISEGWQPCGGVCVVVFEYKIPEYNKIHYSFSFTSGYS